MKLSLTIAAVATLFLSTFVQAKKKTTGLRCGLKAGRTNGADNYFALITAAQENPGRMSSAVGNVIATVRDDTFCIKFSSDNLSSLELFSHVHGPAAVRETGPVIFTVNTNTDKMQCFELTKDQIKDLNDELCFNIQK